MMEDALLCVNNKYKDVSLSARRRGIVWTMAEVQTPVDEKSLQEQALLARAKAGAAGVGEAYDAYADKLYGFLYKRCGNKELAEDLVSKTFLKFLEALPKLEWRGVSLGAWLYRVATNLLTDHWRSASSRMDVAVDSDEWDPPSEAADPAWYAEIALEQEKLKDILKTLSPRDQEILDLRFFGQCEIPELATQLDISQNHASVLVYRALGRLRTSYLKTYGPA